MVAAALVEFRSTFQFPKFQNILLTHHTMKGTWTVRSSTAILSRSRLTFSWCRFAASQQLHIRSWKPSNSSLLPLATWLKFSLPPSSVRLFPENIFLKSTEKLIFNLTWWWSFDPLQDWVVLCWWHHKVQWLLPAPVSYQICPEGVFSLN